MFIPAWLFGLSTAASGEGGQELSPRSVQTRFESYIVSSSGIRAVMAPGGEEDLSPNPSPADLVIAYLVGHAAASFLLAENPDGRTLVVGRDSRPTGEALATAAMAGACAAAGVLEYVGICPSPQIMAYARSHEGAAGFLYVTASHNPVGHNGYKIGGRAGGVLSSEQFGTPAGELQERVKAVDRFFRPSEAPPPVYSRAMDKQQQAREDSEASYRGFVLTTMFDVESREEAATQANRLSSAGRHVPIRIVVDFNGSARAAGPDVSFLKDLGVEVLPLNDRPGEIAHQILPEGPGLADCLSAVESAAQHPASRISSDAGVPVVLGYVPDNDGDRGNIVVYNRELGRAEAVHPQTLLALAALAELGGDSVRRGAPAVRKSPPPESTSVREAIVANGPTSLRLDRVAESLGVEVHRSEVGEANVVNRAQELRRQGYRVRVMGEGSNGGVIIHPSAVRDPLLTTGALIKLIRQEGSEAGDGAADRLTQVLRLIPSFTTSQTGDPEAFLRLSSIDHPRLKARYEELAEARRHELLALLPAELDIRSFRWINYEGTEAKEGRGNRSPGATGGLKLQLEDSAGVARGFLWLRGSKTEALLRLMVDLEGSEFETYRRVMEWHRALVLEAAD